MIEEYENWDNSIRRTFIEIANYMENISNPLDYLIECCETAINTGHWKLDKFTILNAKDELKTLRAKQIESSKLVAFAQVNKHGDLYDLRLQNNPYNDQSRVVPLYRVY